jgi:hypothetical protein
VSRGSADPSAADPSGATSLGGPMADLGGRRRCASTNEQEQTWDDPSDCSSESNWFPRAWKPRILVRDSYGYGMELVPGGGLNDIKMSWRKMRRLPPHLDDPILFPPLPQLPRRPLTASAPRTIMTTVRRLSEVGDCTVPQLAGVSRSLRVVAPALPAAARCSGRRPSSILRRSSWGISSRTTLSRERERMKVKDDFTANYYELLYLDHVKPENLYDSSCFRQARAK